MDGSERSRNRESEELMRQVNRIGAANPARFAQEMTSWKSVSYRGLPIWTRSSLVAAFLFVLLVLALRGGDHAGAPVRFRNVSANAGLRFALENNPTPRKYLVETMPGGVAAFDYDADGLTDIYFTNGASLPSLEKTSPRYWNRLYRNLGGFRFEDVTESAGVAGAGYSMGAAAADYDNDGHVDLFVAGVGRNILYHNRGDGTFDDVTQQARIKGGPRP